MRTPIIGWLSGLIMLSAMSAFQPASAEEWHYAVDVADLPDLAKPEGFAIAPVVERHQDIRVMKGPASWQTPATAGMIRIRFAMLGYSSSHQHDLITIDSDQSPPYAVIRNINSSGRLHGKNVISEDRGPLHPQTWYQVEIHIDTRRGLLQITTNGKCRYQQKTGKENAQFCGIRFSGTVKLKNFSVAIAPLPPISAAEQTLQKMMPPLAARLAALSESTPENQRKKIALSYQWEKLQKAIEQQSFEIGLDLMADIHDGLERNMGRKVSDRPWLQPVAQTQNNPYLDASWNERWYQNFAATADDSWNLPTQHVAAYSSLYGKHGAFTQAVQATEWLMLALHPQSPLVDRPELLLRAMRRIDAYLEDDYYGRKNEHFFALGAAIMGALMLDQTYPEMILPRQKARWIKVVQRIAKAHDGDTGGNYSNADLGYGRIRLACGLFLNDRACTARGLQQVFSWDANIFADGGTSYIAKQNESPGYHHACINLAYDCFIMTRDARITDMLKKLELYPISVTDSNHTMEWYTAPSWKQSWYSAQSCGAHRIVYYLTGNPYHVLIHRSDDFHQPTVPSMKSALVYQSHPQRHVVMPNRYTVYDQNIQGVRMNYDRFSCAMNGRITDQLVGKNTYVGLTLAEPAANGTSVFSAAVYGVNAFPLGANTISRESISVAMGHQFAAIAADYTLAKRLAGPSRREVPWKGRQSWLYLPDRMIGIVELNPENIQRSSAITVQVDLGRAKSGALDHSPIQKYQEATWKFGKLLLHVHDTNLAGVQLSPAHPTSSSDSVRGPYHSWNLVDQANTSSWSKQARDYRGTYYAVIELKPMTTTSVAHVEKIQTKELIGVRVSCHQNTYTALYNSSDADVAIDSIVKTADPSTLVCDDRQSPHFAIPRKLSEKRTIARKQGLILVSGSDPNIRRPGIIGWRKLIDEFEKNPSIFSFSHD
jgi:hypothetical protein